MLEPVHENAVAVERRKSFRTDHSVQPSGSGPVDYYIEERPGNVQIVNAFEPIELCFLRPVIFIEQFIVSGADTPYHFSISDGDEKIRLGVLEEWMLLAVQRQIGVNIQRRHPLPAVPVKSIGQLDEALYL